MENLYFSNKKASLNAYLISGELFISSNRKFNLPNSFNFEPVMAKKFIWTFN
jgi:hypothetical protein